MDIDIVNTILRLCTEQQTCLFEIPFLSDYCLEQRLCANPKYVLASIKNYLEIFKISRDQNRIEFFMPFDICRNHSIDGIYQNNHELCSNFHLCYDYFYTNLCRRSINCPYSHTITSKLHENILGSLINLDLDALTRAFRVYCQSKKHLINHNSLKGQPQVNSKSSVSNNPTSSSSVIHNWCMITPPQVNGSSSWKTNNQPLVPSRTLRKQQIIPQIPEKGLQIRWESHKDIQTHFIEVVFSNQSKSDGDVIRTHKIYQHLGIAEILYQTTQIADRVIAHGPVKFQSLTFTPRLLQRTIDVRHICFTNFPIETTKHIASYIDIVSRPYTKKNFEYYQQDKQIIVVEYNEDIDFAKIFSNVRNHPEYDGSMIDCIQLHHPETLLIEHDQNYSEDDIHKLFDKERIFHIKTYPYCTFVHFNSHSDLVQSIDKTFADSIHLIPIYVNIYSQNHLNNYLQQRRQMESPCEPTITSSSTVKNDPIDSSEPTIPILVPPPQDQQSELLSSPLLNCQSIVEDKNNEIIINNDEDELIDSEDDFHDLPSEFEDDDDVLLDEKNDNNDDAEFLRNAAKHLKASLTEMEAATAETNTFDAPHSLLYGDDCVVTIKNRRFALAFLDYAQFRVEKQDNPERFRLLVSLKKMHKNKKRCDKTQHDDQTLETNEITTNKKKRNKRHRKKKNVNNNNDKDDETQLPT